MFAVRRVAVEFDARRAGVVDEDVEFAEVLLDREHGVVDGVVGGDVELDRVDVERGAERRGGGFAFVDVAGAEENLVGGLGGGEEGEGFDDLVADAGVGAAGWEGLGDGVGSNGWRPIGGSALVEEGLEDLRDEDDGFGLCGDAGWPRHEARSRGCHDGKIRFGCKVRCFYLVSIKVLSEWLKSDSQVPVT